MLEGLAITPASIFTQVSMQDTLGSLFSRYEELQWYRKSIVKAYVKLSQGATFTSDMLMITNTELSMIEQLWNVFLPLAYGVMLLLFLIGMMSDVQKQFRQLDGRFLLVQFLKLIAGQIFLYYGPYFIVGILTVGNYYLDYFVRNPIVSPAMADQSTMYNFYSTLIDAANDTKFLACLMLNVQVLLIEILSLLPTGAIMLAAISRRLTIVLRGGFSCIAMCDFFSDDRRPAAIEYLKKFAAVVFHGFVMLLVLQICQQMSLQQISDTLSKTSDIDITDMSNAVSICLYQFAAVGVITASKQIIADALGTH